VTAGPAKPAPPEGQGAWALRAAEYWRVFRVALPPALVALWVAFFGPGVVQAAVALGVALAASAFLAGRVGAALALRLRAISSVLTAYREGDFAIRVRSAPRASPIGDVLWELNELGNSLRQYRLGEIEAWALLRKVMEEVHVVVLAFDEPGRVKLANAEAARVLRKPVEALLLERASTLGLADLLEGPAARTIKDSPVLGSGHWELRRGAFRLAGEPHALVVLSDVSGALRDEERDAWKRLIRVMGHEINNSLAPIRSVADSLQSLMAQPTRPDDWQEDLSSGLSIVARRAEGLARFIGEYSRLARLPPPQLAPLVVAEWATRVSALERRLPVEVLAGPPVSLLADADQLDQLLINLIKNAVEASLERGGGVRVHWKVTAHELELNVDDDGPGVADTANLFVPFFTTKTGGSGIGLVLARQIAEGHGGTVRLSTRSDQSGARAVVILPLAR
jgi:two-component system, NtrC family, nitrogen regulation sensor histidine kinase NtrY